MKKSVLSIVTVDFHNKTLREEDLPVVEGLLRKDNDIDSLSIHPKRMAFFIRGKEKMDHKILDELKNKLNNLGYLNFEITADEYILSRTGYHYPADVAKNK